MILMKKRQKINYNEIFTFMKKTFFEKMGTELRVPFFHVDCEIAVIKSIGEMFPDSYILLCFVHIVRNFMKNLKSMVDGRFFQNPAL